MRNTLLLSASLVCCVFAAGCRSSDEERGEAALTRLQNQPHPGYVRFVNLTGTSLDVKSKGRTLTAGLPDEHYTLLIPIGTGKQAFQADAANPNVVVESDKGSTTIVYPLGQSETIAGDEKKPASQGNIRIVLAKGDGSTGLPAGGITVEGPRSTPIVKGEGYLTLPVGHYSVADAQTEIEDRCAYTFLFVPQKGKIKAFLLKNTRNEKPLTNKVG